jgi:hypothetical protein
MIANRCRPVLMLALALLMIACAKSVEQPSPSGNGPTMAANELAAVSQLRAIATAEANYQATTGGGSYGTLKQLIDAQSINQQISNGENSGYKFEIKVASGSSYEALATPVKYGLTGLKSFYMNSSGSEIHGADRKGMEATVSDPPL